MHEQVLLRLMMMMMMMMMNVVELGMRELNYTYI